LTRKSARLKSCPDTTSRLQLQRQLDRARAADLIERVEAALRAAGTQEARQRLRRAANSGLVVMFVGLPKLRWLKILKNSAWKRSPTFSVMRNIRCTPISACVASKPRSTLRPKLPCCPEGAAAKAALLKILCPRDIHSRSRQTGPGDPCPCHCRPRSAANKLRVYSPLSAVSYQLDFCARLAFGLAE